MQICHIIENPKKWDIVNIIEIKHTWYLNIGEVSGTQLFCFGYLFETQPNKTRWEGKIVNEFFFVHQPSRVWMGFKLATKEKKLNAKYFTNIGFLTKGASVKAGGWGWYYIRIFAGVPCLSADFRCCYCYQQIIHNQLWRIGFCQSHLDQSQYPRNLIISAVESVIQAKFSVEKIRKVVLSLVS